MARNPCDAHNLFAAWWTAPDVEKAHVLADKAAEVAAVGQSSARMPGSTLSRCTLSPDVCA
eukprot:919646-Rhodomonas_salina.1